MFDSTWRQMYDCRIISRLSICSGLNNMFKCDLIGQNMRVVQDLPARRTKLWRQRPQLLRWQLSQKRWCTERKSYVNDTIRFCIGNKPFSCLFKRLMDNEVFRKKMLLAYLFYNRQVGVVVGFFAVISQVTWNLI